jgi:hypothetical protein
VGSPDTHPEIQVGRFWSEICHQGAVTQSLIARPGESAGIGVVYFGLDFSGSVNHGEYERPLAASGPRTAVSARPK